MTDPLLRQAQLEIDEYRQQLVPAERVVQRMNRLAQEFQAVGQAAQGDLHAIVLRAAAYLKRVADWADVDPRLRLDCVCTLCWTKREEALDALPAALREPLNGDWATPDDLLELWATHRTQMDEGLLARMLTWWAVANLVSNAVHLAAGEAQEAGTRLLQALTSDSAYPPMLN